MKMWAAVDEGVCEGRALSNAREGRGGWIHMTQRHLHYTAVESNIRDILEKLRTSAV